MAKCGTCGNQNSLMTPSKYRAWIQTCGFGKDNPKVPGMDIDDSGMGSWGTVEITNLTVNNKGTPTTIYRRSFNNPCNVVPKTVVRSQPDDNTVDIQMDRRCGGIDIARLEDQKFNIYLQHVCCCGNGTSFLTSWDGAIDVIAGVDVSGFTFSNLTDTGNEEESELRIQLNGVTFDDFYTITELDFAEAALSSGLPTGTAVFDVMYHQCSGGCNNNNCSRCHETCFSIAQGGTLIYSVNGGAMQSVNIPELANATGASMGVVGDRLYIAYTNNASGGADGFVFTELDENCEPGLFTDIQLATDLTLNLHPSASGLYLYGSQGAGQDYIAEIQSSGNVEAVLESTVTGTGLVDMDSCGEQYIAVGVNGTIRKQQGCNSSFSIIPAPGPVATGGITVRSVGVRVEDEIYVGTDDGRVYCSTDCGQNWDEIQFEFSGSGNVRKILWVDESAGFLIHNDGTSTIYTTVDGGHEWTKSAPRLSSQADNAFFTSVDVPCCSNRSLSINNVAFGGRSTAGQGIMYKGTSSSC